MNSKTSLYIGRFQPFHLGHLDAVQQILPETDHILIGIGSAEQSFQPANPFTAGERFQIIRAALDEANVPRSKYDIIPIRNINNYALWVEHVRQYCPPFQTAYTDSDIVAELFEADGRHKVSRLTKNHTISATQVRTALLESSSANQDWKKLVPPAVAKLLTDWNAPAHLKKIQGA